MKRLQSLPAATLFAALLSGSVLAAPASDASIETLMSITRSEAMLDGMHAQMEQAMRQAVQQSTQGRPLTEEQQRLVEQMPARFTTVLRQEFTWAQLKPQYLQIYRDTFDQDEVDGLIAFYRSRVGQSFVAKMPTLMQKSMAVGQNQMMAVFPKLKAALDQAMAEAKIKD